jgi:glutathione S-transferase
MELYFSPMACSMASRIAFYEAKALPTFVEVDPVTKRTLDDRDYRAIHPLGLVPALRTAEGEVLSENGSILQHIAESFPGARLGAETPVETMRLRQWLSFIATELHKATFAPLLDRKAPAEVKAYALDKAAPRLDYLAAHLAGREFLLDRFTVADAYLVTVLTWARATSLDLSRWPVLAAYVARLHERPAVRRALGEEYPLYVAEMARHPAA